MKIQIKLLRPDIHLPVYKHKGDAGMDLCNAGEEVTLKSLERTLIPTGLKVAVPENYELQIRPRSGLALKKGVTVLNTPGTIDAGYRGEIGIIVFNASKESVVIEKGERVAQAVLNKIEHIDWEKVDELDETSRNDGGFGSTGHKK
ncbi:MAG: dUTP diphosphatase [bacterium]